MQPVATGPVGIITGAGSGIGAACALEFGRHLRTVDAGVAADGRIWPRLLPAVQQGRRLSGYAESKMDVRDPRRGCAELIDGADLSRVWATGGFRVGRTRASPDQGLAAEADPTVWPG